MLFSTVRTPSILIAVLVKVKQYRVSHFHSYVCWNGCYCSMSLYEWKHIKVLEVISMLTVSYSLCFSIEDSHLKAWHLDNSPILIMFVHWNKFSTREKAQSMLSSHSSEYLEMIKNEINSRIILAFVATHDRFIWTLLTFRHRPLYREI